ncbi:hypothetical protein BH160DRAFT_3250 [Burkholderia sp. H160]|nr:hypothetical protein BH160DRAFT_3250 [Burkholderia sp. H160]
MTAGGAKHERHSGRATRLVFIVQGLARSVVEDTIAHFLREAGVTTLR